MTIYNHYPLKNHNTFNVEAYAQYFATFANVEELIEILETKTIQNLPLLVLGGGSNILFTKNFEGLVIKNNIKGIETFEDNNFYYLKAAAGEVWHNLVQYSLNQGMAGLENLSLIPGTVGAAPIQNIGAYGVEIKDVFFELSALNIANKQIEKFNKTDCQFGYRDSIFKNQLKNQYVILSVTLALPKEVKFNTNYGNIQEVLKSMNIKEITAKHISEAVIKIRREKLPDPSKQGNAGSFFKNPIISKQLFESLSKQYPQMPNYAVDDKYVKIPAAWLIEQCGWKGKIINNCGVHNKQALVIVNYGNATGNEILNLAKAIIKSVQKKFKITLEKEVNVID